MESVLDFYFPPLMQTGRLAWLELSNSPCLRLDKALPRWFTLGIQLQHEDLNAELNALVVFLKWSLSSFCHSRAQGGFSLIFVMSSGEDPEG